MGIGFKIISLCGGGLLLGLALRAVLPQTPAPFVMFKDQGFVLPLNRLAFWVCLLAGLAAGGITMARAMVRDLGF